MLGPGKSWFCCWKNRHSKVGIADTLSLECKVSFRWKDSLIMGLVVGRIRLLKSLIRLQPFPEAGDWVVTVHIVCSAERLLRGHPAWQSSRESCVMAVRLGCRKQGWARGAQLSLPVAWSIPPAQLLPTAEPPNEHCVIWIFMISDSFIWDPFCLSYLQYVDPLYCSFSAFLKTQNIFIEITPYIVKALSC